MKLIPILLLLSLATSGCADPTRVVTNKPKFIKQKQKERDERRQEDKAGAEALKNFRITDYAGKKTEQANQQKKTQPSPKDSQINQAEKGRQTFSALETPNTQSEKK